MKTYLLDETLPNGVRIQHAIEIDEAGPVTFVEARSAYYNALMAEQPSAGAFWASAEQLPFEEQKPTPPDADKPDTGDKKGKGKGDK